MQRHSDPRVEDEKAKGNAAFGKQDYVTAIAHYSAAIAIDPEYHVCVGLLDSSTITCAYLSHSSLYSNRAACYSQLQGSHLHYSTLEALFIALMHRERQSNGRWNEMRRAEPQLPKGIHALRYRCYCLGSVCSSN